MKKLAFLPVSFLLIWSISGQAQTLTISSFSPASGAAGTSVTINGTGFNATMANNKVFIGAVPAVVTSATTTKLVITIPASASSKAGIMVVNTTSRLSYTSDKSFILTYTGGIDPSNPVDKQFPSYSTGSSAPDLSGEGLTIGSGRKMVSGDFDLDGNIDVAAQGTVASNTMTVFRNAGKANLTLSSPGFAAGVTIALNANTTTTSIDPYDFNNDGKLDILQGGTNHFTVLVNTSTGAGNIGFSKSTFSPTGTYNSQKCIAADMNKDGKMDIIAINPNRTSGFSISLFLNTSTGAATTFNTTPTNYTLPVSIGDIIAVDIDNDGDKDLVFSTDRGTTYEAIYYLENTTTTPGTLTLASNYYVINNLIAAGNYPGSAITLAYADFDKDGDQDLISISKPNTGGTLQLISMHRNDGSLGFISLSIGNLTTSTLVSQCIRTGDLNGDGLQDILFADVNGSSLYAIFNKYTSGSLSVVHFSLQSTAPYAPGSSGFVMDDFTGDGKIDIISNMRASGNLLFMHNGTVPYYVKSGSFASINTVTSWSSIMDGTGSSPANFNSGTFILDNTQATTSFYTNNNLSITGKLIIPAGKSLELYSNELTINGSTDIKGNITGSGSITLNGTTAHESEGTISAYNLTLNNAAGFTQNTGTITIANNLTLTSGRLNLTNHAALVLKGPISRTSGNINATSGLVTFNGTTAQTVPVATFNGFYGVTIDNPAGVTLNDSRAIPILSLTNGVLTIGSNTITNTNITGGSSASWVRVSGTGKFKRWTVNGNPSFFPVGNASYNPVTITNFTGVADYIGVSVLNEVYANGVSGTTITDARVKRTWDITKDKVNTGNGINFTFNWSNEEATGINTPALFHYEGGKWVMKPGTSTSTANSMTYTGYTGTFSPFFIGDITSLPVTWLGFTATKQQQQISLNWQTSAEWQAKDFIVQHSTNGIDWTAIGTIPARGNSTSISSYQFEHKSPVPGNNYYRLWQRDIDGNSSYSKVVNAIWGNAPALLSVYPVPVVNGVLNVQLRNAAEIVIHAVSGEVVLRKQLPAGKHVLQTGHLPKGLYTLKAGTEVARIVLQ